MDLSNFLCKLKWLFHNIFGRTCMYVIKSNYKMIENPTKMVKSHSALLDNAPKYIVGRYPKDNENFTSSSSLVRNVDILEANS